MEGSSRCPSSSPRSTTMPATTLQGSPRTKGLRPMTHISVFPPLRSGATIMHTWPPRQQVQRRYLPSITTPTPVPACPSGDSLDLNRSRPTFSTCTKRTSKRDFKLSGKAACRSRRSSQRPAVETGLNGFTGEETRETILRTKITKIITTRVVTSTMRTTLMQHRLVTFPDFPTSMRSRRD